MHLTFVEVQKLEIFSSIIPVLADLIGTMLKIFVFKSDFTPAFHCDHTRLSYYVLADGEFWEFLDTKRQSDKKPAGTPIHEYN